MKVGVLTAALQELTPRAVRDADPDRAIEDWAAFAREIGADYVQLSAALHPTEADVPPEAMLDPVANTLDLRRPFDRERAKRVRAALDAGRIGLSDLGYFDNMLHEDAAVRAKKHDFMKRVMDAAVLLGAGAV
jgi:sugar phosphate isomerase/epimerase